MITLSRRPAMTAIEVLASTILSTLLMTALIGVLRGLKAHEKALESHVAAPTWQQSLDAVLDRDLMAAQTYQATPATLILHGFGGRSNEGGANWRPAIVTYVVRSDGECNWLVRREQGSGRPAPQAREDLVMRGVQELRVGALSATDAIAEPLPPPGDSTSQAPRPVMSGLVIELWQRGGYAPLYRYAFHSH